MHSRGGQGGIGRRDSTWDTVLEECDEGGYGNDELVSYRSELTEERGKLRGEVREITGLRSGRRWGDTPRAMDHFSIGVTWGLYVEGGWKGLSSLSLSWLWLRSLDRVRGSLRKGWSLQKVGRWKAVSGRLARGLGRSAKALQVLVSGATLEVGRVAPTTEDARSCRVAGFNAGGALVTTGTSYATRGVVTI